MAATGEAVTYRDYEARCNRLAHFLRNLGLKWGDHYAIFMENNVRYLECCGAGARTGLFYTCVNSHLKAEETAYILDNSESQILFTSEACRSVALEAASHCSRIRFCVVVDGPGDGGNVVNLDEALAGYPDGPVRDERLGSAMLYSSGTTGKPKGVLRFLPDEPPEHIPPLYAFLADLWLFRENMTYLSPAPLYHAAPLAGVSFTIRCGGTVIIMEQFDPEQFLRLVEQYDVTHSQLVPTMFSRMLKLPKEIRDRYDVSSLEVAIHAAAPCPIPVKEQMIDWWGPIILEYYAMTEGLGVTACNSEEWLAHRGTVGRAMFGEMHILDNELNPCPPGVPGQVWFKSATQFEYYNDPERTAEAHSPDGELITVGDVGYVDDEGYLYLTDRASFMIVSGGVNIYPQECENLLITHPKVTDAAVFGVPNEDLGEEVKAVVQLADGQIGDQDLEAELIAFCRMHLAHQKCPKSIDFIDALPRAPTGKLYKTKLRDRYWGDQKSRILGT